MYSLEQTKKRSKMRQSLVWYQVNPHYFAELASQKGWINSQTENLNFFGLLKANLDRIYDLGCDGIWLMPIYKRGQKRKKGFGSPYAVNEYQVSAEWGSEEDLRNLILTAKERNMKVIGEYVPNHLAFDAPFLKSAGDLCYLDMNGNPFFDQNWNDIIKLNHSNPLVQSFTSANLTWLMKNFGFDGFRLDMAHYPLYGASGSLFGSGDPRFWEKIFTCPFFDPSEKLWIAEVYDDRSQEMHGYYDHLRLMKSGMTVYDKKTHDIISAKLKHQNPFFNLQRKLYNEFFVQGQICKSADINLKKEAYPFLRIPSNHDDCPAIKIYGNLAEYSFALQLMACLPGSLMIYAGEEFGLAEKPSVTGLEHRDQNGQITETNEIKLVEQAYQTLLHESIKRILKLRRKYQSLNSGEFLCLRLCGNSSDELDSMFGFVRFSREKKEITLVVGNFAKDGKSQWAKVNEFFPAFDFPNYKFYWGEFLDYVNPDIKTTGYRIENLLTGETSTLYNHDYELWVGVNPLELQVLKISVS